ncbi:MAG: MATE family efflux transporter [Succinivibrionaceae bacterium]|nr:MATE family efflux transporter [Succinivibrionaceae bacterium]
MRGILRESLPRIIRESPRLGWWELLALTARLGVPAMLTQLSMTMMMVIDASMVGRLGAAPAASIALVSTSTWLLWGLLRAGVTGFSVTLSHRLGAGDAAGARDLVRRGCGSAVAYGLLLGALAALISPFLPTLLGGSGEIARGASTYFLIFALSLPVYMLDYMMDGFIRSTGRMGAALFLNTSICALDIAFNFLLIFPTRTYVLGPLSLTVWGADLGIFGAALGSSLAVLCVIAVEAVVVFRLLPELSLRGTRGSFLPTLALTREALRIGLPVGAESTVFCLAMILITSIIAPLGPVALAANSFAVVIESVCYMPGYGIGNAASTLVGQAVGARRPRLVRDLSLACLAAGMGVMALSGALMYVFAPELMAMVTPFADIGALGTTILRIEAFAEPLFGASIVCYYAFVASGRAVVPAVMNLASIWGCRVPLSFLLAPLWGLEGVWVAMCAELCLRGLIFLWRLLRFAWVPRARGDAHARL